MIVKGRKYLIGADPEVFIREASEKDKPHPAYGLILGTKENPHPVKKGAVQVDGMALEFNIDPCEDVLEFQNNLKLVQDQLKDMVPDYEFMEACSVEFDKFVMDFMPPMATELGCEPDFNAYTGKPNPKPNAESCTRTAGGHVHVGGFESDKPEGNKHMIISSHLAKLLDEEIGVYSILWDHNDSRREMYGQAGAFRPKKYGMEYRTLSNMWVFKPQLVSFVFRGVQRALENLFNFKYEFNPDIPNIINKSARDSSFFKDNKLAEDVGRIMTSGMNLEGRGLSA